jgi:hypothetical protein
VVKPRAFSNVGVLLGIVLDIGRVRFADRARHIMWGERENGRYGPHDEARLLPPRGTTRKAARFSAGPG